MPTWLLVRSLSPSPPPPMTKGYGSCAAYAFKTASFYRRKTLFFKKKILKSNYWHGNTLKTHKCALYYLRANRVHKGRCSTSTATYKNGNLDRHVALFKYGNITLQPPQ